MLAIPLDTKDSTTLSKLFGRAPYFALLDLDTKNYEVIENKAKGKGPLSAEFLKTYNVTSTIFYHMGEGVYKSFVKNGMDVYTANYALDSIDTIYQNINSGSYEKLTKNNYKKLLDPGEGETCSCGCEG